MNSVVCDARAATTRKKGYDVPWPSMFNGEPCRIVTSPALQISDFRQRQRSYPSAPVEMLTEELEWNDLSSDFCPDRQPRLCMLRIPTQPGGTISNPPPSLTPERSDEEDQRINESSEQISPQHRRTVVADGPYGAERGPDPLTYRESADITRAILEDEENEGDIGDYRPMGRGATTSATKLQNVSKF